MATRAPGGHVQAIERQGHAPGPGLQLGVGQLPQGPGGLRLVDHGHPGAVHQRRPVQEIRHRQCNPHHPPTFAIVRVWRR